MKAVWHLFHFVCFIPLLHQHVLSLNSREEKPGARPSESQHNIDPVICGPASQRAPNKVRKGVFQMLWGPNKQLLENLEIIALSICQQFQKVIFPTALNLVNFLSFVFFFPITILNVVLCRHISLTIVGMLEICFDIIGWGRVRSMKMQCLDLTWGVEWMRCPTVAFQILPCVYTGLAFGKAVPVRAGLSLWVTWAWRL